MKVLPTRSLVVHLRPDDDDRWERLKRATKCQKTLWTTEYPTGNLFVGQISVSKFRLIRSAVGFGALCVFCGDFSGPTGKVDVVLHPAFRILLLIWMGFPIIMIIISVVSDGVQAGLIGLLTCAVLVAMMRLILEFFFRRFSDQGLRELAGVLQFTR